MPRGVASAYPKLPTSRAGVTRDGQAFPTANAEAVAGPPILAFDAVRSIGRCISAATGGCTSRRARAPTPSTTHKWIKYRAVRKPRRAGPPRSIDAEEREPPVHPALAKNRNILDVPRVVPARANLPMIRGHKDATATVAHVEIGRS